jgi:hypothetical protein
MYIFFYNKRQNANVVEILKLVIITISLDYIIYFPIIRGYFVVFSTAFVYKLEKQHSSFSKLSFATVSKLYIDDISMYVYFSLIVFR